MMQALSDSRCGGKRMAFWQALDMFGQCPALIEASGGVISYAELARRADSFAHSVRVTLPAGLERPLVLIETANEVAPIVAYLGALRAGWPVILLADGAVASDDRIRSLYRPNYVFRRNRDGWGGTADNLAPIPMHPDLAVLLSTSGTTGAPKLVRLSRGNLSTNAESIAEYLGIDRDERAITTLSFHYSYGMSVLHTHLLRGAALVLTDRSVVDEEFWAAFVRHRATSLALVPFQFDLLDSTGFRERRLPSLGYVTQAGGKLAEASIRRFAALGRRDGWKLFVMYGQTEAAPRMAYLPPDDIEAYAGSIGRPVPGGRFDLIDALGRPIVAAGIAGELVYQGPNVMMGYATSATELAAPQGPSQLHTGDIAERLASGHYRIVGRASRFVKLFGLRVSLDEVEQWLRGQGIAAYCAGTDQRLSIFLQGAGEPATVRAQIASHYALTEASLHVERLDAVPLLASGKVDYRALTVRATAAAEVEPLPLGDIEAVIRSALRGGPVDFDRSFAELGGDSLAYLDVQLSLTERLGAVPAGWESLPLRELLALAPAPRSRLQEVSTDLLCRVLALSSVIALHATSLPIAGGATLLLVLSGFSLARFQRARLLEGKVGAVLATMLVPIVVCYFAILSLASLVWKPVDPEWFLLAGNFDSDINPRGITPYWFVCLYVQAIVLVCLPFAWPGVRTFAAQKPILAGAGLVAMLAGLCQLPDLPGLIPQAQLRHPVFALQLIAIGWCIFHARTREQKALVSLLAFVDFALLWRSDAGVLLFLLGGCAALIWIASVPLPAWASWVALLFGKNSMLIYLAHVIVLSVVEKLHLTSEALVFAGTLGASLIAAELFHRAFQFAAGWRLGSISKPGRASAAG